MAGITASGLGGSGLDVNSLVSQLVAAERAPLQQRISRVESEINTKLSALGVVRGALSTLQSTLSGIKTVESLQVRRTSVSDATVFRATSTSAASPATYSVEVVQLAAAHKKSSAEQAGGATATVGSGTLDITQNGQSFSVVVDASMTLSSLRDAINNSATNTGVRASILTTQGGARLTLTSSQTGVQNAFTITASGGSPDFDTFVSGMTDIVTAQDGTAKIDGFTVTSANNTISGAIQGVTLDLLVAKPGTTLALSVTNDLGAVRERINKVVNDFNNFQTQAARQRAYDPKTRVGGPLLGDAGLRSIESVIRREMTGATISAPADLQALSAIGIRFGADGRLAITDSQLTAALNNRFDDVAKIFTATDGLVARVTTAIDAQISAEGALTQRTNSLDQRKRTVEKDKESMETRLAMIEKRYRAQFIGLDRMLSEMQGTSSYIAKIGSGK